MRVVLATGRPSPSCPPRSLTCPGASLLHQPQQPLLLEDDAASDEEAGEDSQAQANPESITAFQPIYPEVIQRPIVPDGVRWVSVADHLAHDPVGKARKRDQGPCETTVGISQQITDMTQHCLCWPFVLGLARTGLIFTGLQEGAQPGGGG